MSFVNRIQAFAALLKWRATQTIIEDIESQLEEIEEIATRNKRRYRSYYENKKHTARKHIGRIETIKYYEERNIHSGSPIPTRVYQIRRMTRYTKNNFR